MSMTRWLGTVLASVLVAGVAGAAPKDSEIKVEKLPATAEELVALRDQVAKTPQGGAAIFVLALMKYAEDPKLGRDFLTVAIEQDQLVDDASGFKGRAPDANVMRFLKDTLLVKPYITRSYVTGTSAEKGYALPALPLVIRLKEQDGDVGPASARIFVYSTGADTPRPLRVKKNDKGFWKAAEWSSLCVGVRPPPKVQKDDL